MSKKRTKRSTEKKLQNYCTQFYLQNEASNKEIYHEVLEEFHRKCGAKSRYEVFRNASRSFRVSAGGARCSRERGEMRVNGPCFVYRCSQCHSRGI